MSARTRLVAFIVTILFICIYFGCTARTSESPGNVSSESQSINQKEYTISEIEKDSLYEIYDNLYREEYREDSIPTLREGLQELSERYHIEEIVTLTAKYGYSNSTRALLVFVKVK